MIPETPLTVPFLSNVPPLARESEENIRAFLNLFQPRGVRAFQVLGVSQHPTDRDLAIAVIQLQEKKWDQVTGTVTSIDPLTYEFDIKEGEDKVIKAKSHLPTITGYRPGSLTDLEVGKEITVYVAGRLAVLEKLARKVIIVEVPVLEVENALMSGIKGRVADELRKVIETAKTFHNFQFLVTHAYTKRESKDEAVAEYWGAIFDLLSKGREDQVAQVKEWAEQAARKRRGYQFAVVEEPHREEHLTHKGLSALSGIKASEPTSETE